MSYQFIKNQIPQLLKNEFLFQNSPLYIFLCLILGLVYAFLLYQKQSKWSKKINLALAGLRFLVGSITAFLLLNLLLRLVTQQIDKRKVLIAIDNSQSIANESKNNIEAIRKKLKEIKANLNEKNLDASFIDLTGKESQNVDSLSFTNPSSNFSELFSGIKNNYEGRNLSDVIFLSDGIFNKSISPISSKFPFQVHTIALGDTIPKKDVFVKNVYANKVAYLGNEFPISADIAANGFAGKAATVLLKNGKEVLGSEIVNFETDKALQTLNFKTTAKGKRLQHYTIDIQPIAGEYSLKNNHQEIYIEVIDGKEKILLLALAPHPDIKAIKSIIEKNENYELDVKILGQYTTGTEPEKKYDLLILHQLPEFFNTGNDLVQKYIKQNIPVFYFLANQSSTSQLNNLQEIYKINSGAGQTDKVTGFFNPNFKLVNFEAEKMDLLKKLPPISVPFGEYQLMPNAEILLYQKVGNVPTQKPLFVVSKGTKKSALFLGEGLWQWRMEEFALTEKQEIIDDLILKIIQFISAKDDNRKLRVYPTTNEFLKGEKVSFETEIYNDIYERILNQNIDLVLTDEVGKSTKYNYSNTEAGSRFEISNLSGGLYRYTASAVVLGKKEETKGEFIIRELQLESLNSTADHDLLRAIANKTGGKFSFLDNLEQILKAINTRNLPDKIDSFDETKELINLQWIFFLILILATIEWIARKYLGSY